MTTTIVSAVTENTPFKNCENGEFRNTYYLIDTSDFYSASYFYQEITRINSRKETNFGTLIGESDRTIIYYDFDDLDLLHAGNELVSILNNNFPDYIPEREQILYIDTRITPAKITKFETKNYNNKFTLLDKHPLFSRIKRKQRSILINQLESISKSPPDSISQSLKIKLSDNIYFMELYGVSYGSITMSRFHISNYSVPNTFLLMKLEISHDLKDNLTTEEYSSLNTFFCQIENKFKIKFPYTKSVPWFSYDEYNQLAMDNLPSRDLFRKYPRIFTIGQIIILSLLGFLFMYLIIGRYSKRDDYSKVSKLKKN
ncbi:MAG: hypothetical protein ACI9XC_000464 [Gammaproteobacteria bacterium]|jgi:hypothetical protein